MGILGERPAAQQKRRQAGELQRAVAGNEIAGGMLHEGVGDDDEVSRQPATAKERHSDGKMLSLTELFFAENEKIEKGALQKKGEQALHAERLADDGARQMRKARPVGPELELHGDAGDDTDGKRQAEDANPEARSVGVDSLLGAQRAPFVEDDDGREAHRELRKQIVKDDGKGELQTVPDQCVGHGRRSLALRGQVRRRVRSQASRYVRRRTPPGTQPPMPGKMYKASASV